MKKIVCLLAFILSGCVYEQSPAPINAVDIIDETPKQPVAPTSISYPLPDTPHDINNVIVNQPQPIPNSDIMAPQQDNAVNGINVAPISADQTTVPQQNNDQLIDSIISGDAPSQNPVKPQAEQAPAQPMGSYNNPVRFDQSKVY